MDRRPDEGRIELQDAGRFLQSYLEVIGGRSMFSNGRLVADIMMMMITHSLLLYKSEIEDTWERISNYVFA